MIIKISVLCVQCLHTKGEKIENFAQTPAEESLITFSTYHRYDISSHSFEAPKRQSLNSCHSKGLNNAKARLFPVTYCSFPANNKYCKKSWKSFATRSKREVTDTISEIFHKFVINTGCRSKTRDININKRHTLIILCSCVHNSS